MVDRLEFVGAPDVELQSSGTVPKSSGTFLQTYQSEQVPQLFPKICEVIQSRNLTTDRYWLHFDDVCHEAVPGLHGPSRLSVPMSVTHHVDTSCASKDEVEFFQGQGVGW